jgi:hypothetical protein
MTAAAPLDFSSRQREKMSANTAANMQQSYHSTCYLKVDVNVLRFLDEDWKAACFLAKVLDLQALSTDG